MLPPPLRETEALAEGCGEQGYTGAPCVFDKLWAWKDPDVTCDDNGGRRYGRNL